MPEMVMMTYRIPDEIRRIAYNEDFNEFDLNVFFAAKPEVEGHPETAQFVYKDYVQKWLSLIRGAYMPSTVDDLKLGQNAKPVMPYSDARMLSVLNHTLWFLPNVASCYAMANLLAEKQNVFYHDYTVNVCAGTAAGVGLAALGPAARDKNHHALLRQADDRRDDQAVDGYFHAAEPVLSGDIFPGCIPRAVSLDS
jgi:hypothetical protein